VEGDIVNIYFIHLLPHLLKTQKILKKTPQRWNLLRVLWLKVKNAIQRRGRREELQGLKQLCLLCFADNTAKAKNRHLKQEGKFFTLRSFTV